MNQPNHDWRRKKPGAMFRALNPFGRLKARLLLSRAKHRSLAGHPRIALRLSRLFPSYSYSQTEAFASDGAPADIQTQRHAGFMELGASLRAKSPLTRELATELRHGLSDAEFVDNYRVPFQFRDVVRSSLPVSTIVDATRGGELRDLDGNWNYDLGGSYGVNLFGTDFYKSCIQRSVERAGELGLVLGSYHPVVSDNVRRLREISGLDEVSFHMSGTEAVMQAVRLARFHTRRSHVVRFTGAYHGWWDGVNAGPGNPRPSHEVYTLSEMSETTLKVLRTRGDIACVLVNPIQAMHPNSPPPSDAMLVASDRTIRYDRKAYGDWLKQLRAVCTERGIVLIFDEVFLGFRLARSGVQEYFGVAADMVTYGKSLGGGFPVGALVGKRSLMRRFNPAHPGDICLARGTFNAHPYVMTAMNEFLQHIDTSEVRTHYRELDTTWDARATKLNEQLTEAGVPVRVANMTSVWSTVFLTPSRFNWLLQFYLRAEGLSMSWVGTGRFIFSHATSEADMAEISQRFVRAASRMHRDGWWWNDGTLTNKSIKRQVLRELFRAVWKPVRPARGQAPVPNGSLGQSIPL